MPFPNEHAARQTEPEQYDEFRRYTPKGAPAGLTMILGIKDGKSEVQSLRADASKMSAAEFAAWLKEHEFKDTVEEATRKGGFESFARWVPLELGAEALAKAQGDEAPATARIGGICSTDDMDFEGERIAQDGLDWSYFLKHGWFNHEHQQGPSAVLGHPTRVEPVDEHRTRVEGEIYLNKPLAREIYETAYALHKAGAPRSLGFSIEGQVLARDPVSPKQVLKARVLNVAITSAPVNPHTNLELIARSMGAAAGYQSPAIPDADASLSALMDQSLAPKLSSATTQAPVSPKRTMSRAQVLVLMRSRFPEMGDEELDALVARVMASARNLQKNA